MARRNKVKLAWIANDSARRATFKKRKKGLLKKVSELSTLCGVEACAIVYGPYEPSPEVWPSLKEARDVLSRFKNMPKIEQSKNVMNQEGFFRQMIAKTRKQCKKLQRENRLYEMQQLMKQSIRGKGVRGLLSDELGHLSRVVQEKMRNVHDRIDYLKRMVSAPHVIPEGNERDPMPKPMQMPMPMLRQMPRPMPMQMLMGNGIGNGSEAEKTVGHPYMLNAMQRYPTLMDLMNHSHGGGYFAGNDLRMPYGENIAWPSTFFPR